MATLNDVQEHPVMKQVLSDSMGGVLYNVANRDKYDTTELLELWSQLPAAEQSAAGGIITGAIIFLRGD